MSGIYECGEVTSVARLDSSWCCLTHNHELPLHRMYPLRPLPYSECNIPPPTMGAQAQIEDGHGMAERVSRSVRRLDDIQMRVQRALALVEDVINLRGCAEASELLQ